jgi:hypothetical protein
MSKRRIEWNPGAENTIEIVVFAAAFLNLLLLSLQPYYSVFELRQVKSGVILR